MNTDDFSKMNEELKKEIQKNDEQININSKRKKISTVNQFENRAILTMTFSLLAYIVLFILSALLLNFGLMLALIKIIPVESFPFAFLGSSLCLGTIGRKIKIIYKC